MALLTKLFRFLRDNDDGIKQRTLRAGVLVGASSVVVNILSLLRSVVLARLLSPEIFGLWAICTTLVRALKVFSETGLSSALIQRQDRAAEAVDTAFTLLIVRGALLTLITVAAAPYFAFFYEKPILEPLVSILAVAFLISGFHNIHTVLYEKELKYRRLVLLEQLSQILTFIFVVVVAYIYRNIWALVAGHLAAAVISVVMSYLVISDKPRIKFNKKIAWELFHYGKYVSGAAIVVFLTFEIDNLVIAKLLGMEALGFYTIAFMLGNLPATHLAKVVSGVMLPAYSKLQLDLNALRSAYLRTLEFVSLFAIPTAVGLCVLAPQIVGVIYGERWLPAVEALRVLAVFGCVRSISALRGYLFNAIGKPQTTFYITVTKLIIIAVLIYPLTVTYGIVGAALAVTGPAVLASVADFFLVRRIIGLELRKALAPLLRTSIFSGLMAVVLLVLHPYLGGIDFLSLLASILIGAATYLLLAWRDLSRMYSWISSKRS